MFTNFGGDLYDILDYLKELVFACAEKDQNDRGVSNSRYRKCQRTAIMSKILAQIVCVLTKVEIPLHV